MEQLDLFPGLENTSELYIMITNGFILKFQSVALPNGLIPNMYGPVSKAHVWINHVCIFAFVVQIVRCN